MPFAGVHQGSQHDKASVAVVLKECGEDCQALIAVGKHVQVDVEHPAGIAARRIHQTQHQPVGARPPPSGPCLRAAGAAQRRETESEAASRNREPAPGRPRHDRLCRGVDDGYRGTETAHHRGGQVIVDARSAGGWTKQPPGVLHRAAERSRRGRSAETLEHGRRRERAGYPGQRHASRIAVTAAEAVTVRRRRSRARRSWRANRSAAV